jgi:hypothetical protein
MASRTIITCLFKTASFDQMRSHLIAIEGRELREPSATQHVDYFQSQANRRSTSDVSRSCADNSWKQARGQPPGCPTPIQTERDLEIFHGAS